ncbi:flagellar protein [Bacillaceae bacterium Marseille-Q3522]|nr:flagellar protein [Bacillaceae bacterium Marseille-Q3522]
MANTFYRPIQSQPVIQQNAARTKSFRNGNNRFASELQAALQSTGTLTISKHASERIKQRGIEIADFQWDEIDSKVQEAKKMGVQDSLVLLKNAALIVSVKNNTVITALGREEAASQIFTNINGTIVME